MASNGFWAIGTQLYVEDVDNLGTYFEFPEVITLGLQAGNREDIDLSSHDSTPPFTDTAKGFATGANIAFTFNYIPGNVIQNTIRDYRTLNEPFNVWVVFNDDTLNGIRFLANLASFDTQHDARDAHRGSGAFTPTGAWEDTVGLPPSVTS